MMKYFTFNYCVNKVVVVDSNKNVDQFIGKALNDEFSPSDQSLKNILSFSNAYCHKESKSIGSIENVLN